MTRQSTLDEAPGVDVSAFVAKLEAFEALIGRWNHYGGLVSKGDLPRLRERHTLDSLAFLPWWRGRLADVGSGAGFPGVPLAIARPEAPVVLIERSERKSRFLRQVLIDLDLSNVELVVADATHYREARFETVVARAVAPPQAAWRLVRPLLALGGFGVFQSRERLSGALFAGGRVVASKPAGKDNWVTAVAAE